MHLGTHGWMMMAATALGAMAFSGDVAAGGENFDRTAASEALKSVDIGHCRTKKGPSGNGHVIVQYETSGVASAASADTPPFAGTKVGDCIAKAYKKTRIPAFAGTSVKVGKTFVL
jgi:hypothetical protein